MIATHIRKPLFAAMALFVVAAQDVQAAPETADAKYRLQIAPQDYKLQSDPAYQLAAEYRRPVPVVEQPQRRQATPLPQSIALKPFAREIEMAALDASVDPALVHAVIHIESGYRHDAVSSKGALGLMQVMPGTAARYGVRANRPTVQKNLDVGTRYLHDLMQMFDDRLDLVLAAYNAGEGAVRRYSDKIPPYPETQSYVRAVLAKYAELGGIVAKRALPPPHPAKRPAAQQAAAR
jgi:soluble lytic murein transglycosylase-like protein